MRSVKFTKRAGIIARNTLLTGNRKILADDKDEKKYKVVSELNLINKTAYNDLTHAQEDIVCFNIV